MTELRLTLDAMSSSPALMVMVDQLVERESKMVNQLLVYAMILILFSFLVLFAYRFVVAKTIPK